MRGTGIVYLSHYSADKLITESQTAPRLGIRLPLLMVGWLWEVLKVGDGMLVNAFGQDVSKYAIYYCVRIAPAFMMLVIGFGPAKFSNIMTSKTTQLWLAVNSVTLFPNLKLFTAFITCTYYAHGKAPTLDIAESITCWDGLHWFLAVPSLFGIAYLISQIPFWQLLSQVSGGYFRCAAPSSFTS